MTKTEMKIKPLITILLIFAATTCLAQAVDYPVLAVRSVRNGDDHFPRFSEVFDPIQHPISDLVIVHPSGTEEVLVSGNGTDAILDPKTLDGVNVFFVRIPNYLDRNSQRRHAAKGGADIYSINIETREETRWTDQTDTPMQGFADWSKTSHGYGVFNMGPQPLPDGRLVYVSSRRRLEATKTYTFPCMQLHVRHPDGRIECIGVMSQGSALHPELLRDGRIAFSSYESMGLRDVRRWSLWQIHPDGTNWGPLISAYDVTAFHFHTQRTSGEIVATEYYNLQNDGFGTLLGLDEFPTYADPSIITKILAGWHFDGKERFAEYRFAPSGFRTLTPWAHARDESSIAKSVAPEVIKSETVTGNRLGKVSHPSAAPGSAILVAFSGGPINRQTRPSARPSPHFQIRILKKDTADGGPDDLELIIGKDGFNYTQPRALVSFRDIYGTDPIALPDKADHSKSYGVFGSSDAFVGQWKFGLDSGATGEPRSLVVIGAEPNAAQIYGWTANGFQFGSGTSGWKNGINERLRILGEYDFSEPDRPAGDHSFRLKVPADVPFTVAIRSDDGRFATCGQSWKQVRPGTQEINCGGCHNHAGEPISGVGKYAWRDDYVLQDFTGQWRTPEFNRDVLPILEAHCYECHGADQGEGATMANLVLDAAGAWSKSKPLQAGKSPLSHRIHGEGGLDQMPLGREPLSAEEIQIIDEWIDLGALVDDGSGSAFDVFDQVPNPNPLDEAIPIGGEPVPEPDDRDRIIAEQAATIEELRLKIQNAKEALK